MEARLFFISIWCGVYAQLLRLVFRTERLVNKVWMTALFNSFFWATGASMFGMLLASYFEKIERVGTYSALFAVIGFFGGILSGYWQGRDPEKRDVILKDNLEWADTGFSAILLASVVMFFVVQAFKIPSGSMRMTFVEGDHLFVNKFIYGVPVPFTEKKIHPFRAVTKGDIVIFRFPSDDKTSMHYGKDFIKRVVATEGQKVQVVNKKVFVDGVEQVEPFKQNVDPSLYPALGFFSPERFQQEWENRGMSNILGNEIRDNFGPVLVPQGHVFVMGDNRDRSFDSRFWGPLPLKLIKGKAWLKYWGPLDPEKLQQNPWLRFWIPARFHLVH